MDIRITAVKGVAHWVWDGAKDDDCGICRRPYDDCCPACTVPGDDCIIVVGKCTHTFHIHCIEKWGEQNRDCPMCRQPWELDFS